MEIPYKHKQVHIIEIFHCVINSTVLIDIAGKGKLTQDKGKKIKKYNGKAIKDHSDDIPLLKRRNMAIHEEQITHQKHAHYPPGETSWFFWQRPAILITTIP